MAEQQGSPAVRNRIEINKPRLFKVIFHNDDLTPMDLVVYILVSIFRKNENEATSIMLKVHHEGEAVAGVYPLDIAASKTQRALAMARGEGYPLQITCQPE